MQHWLALGSTCGHTEPGAAEQETAVAISNPKRTKQSSKTSSKRKVLRWVCALLTSLQGCNAEARIRSLSGPITSDAGAPIQVPTYRTVTDDMHLKFKRK